MGQCYCTQSTIVSNRDLKVPKNFNDYMSNRQRHANSHSNNLKTKVMSRTRSFMKVKTIKSSQNKNTFSTEQILAKTKTINPNYGVDITQTIEPNQLNPDKNYYNSPKKSPKKPMKNSLKNISVLDIGIVLPTQDQHEEAVETSNISYQADEIEVTNEQENIVINTLKNHFLFRHFDSRMIKMIIDNSMACQVQKGDNIYNEGEEGEAFFMIQSGTAQVTSKNSKEVITLTTGDTFGEMALIYSKVIRTQKVTALTQLNFYIIFGNSYRETSKNFSKHSIEQNIYFINGSCFLENIDPVIKLNLASLMTLEEFEKNEIIYSNKNNNEELNKIFLVKSGIITIITSENTKTIYPKDNYGELQVILGIEFKEDVEIVSEEASSVYVITRQLLIETIGSNYKEIILYSMFVHGIKKNSFFKTLLLECYYTSVYELFKRKEYTNDTVVYSHLMSENKKAVFILDGELVDQDKSLIAGKGVLFGDEVINSNENLGCKIYAQGEDKIITLEADWIDIRNLLHQFSKNSSLDLFKRAYKISKMYIFKHINESKILELCQLMNKIRYLKDDIIISEKEEVNLFYVISKGRVRITKQGKLIREIDEGNCFGEIALLYEEKSDVTIIALDEVQCYTLEKNIFLKFLKNENMNDYIKKKMCIEDTNIQLKDLYNVIFLGRGKFGTVNLVHNCISLYAIKTIPKVYVEHDSFLSKYILSEKNILLSLDYPLIVKLVKTLKSENLCFFLMEYIDGWSLEDYISSKKKHKNVAETKFFGACLTLILHYLNKKSITHRDVKPSNLMIDSSGYIKIVDFGTAKKLKDYTFTLIGTPNCVAPEILLGKGYSFPCDYWSLGVCMYYSYYGYYPFGQGTNDVLQIYDEVMNKEVNFIKGDQSACELNIFLGLMLNKKPTNRLCTLQKIENDQFYKHFNWKEFKEFKMKSPTVVKIKERKDIGHILKNTRHPFLPMIMKEKFDMSSIHNDEKKVCDYNTMRDYSNWFHDF